MLTLVGTFSALLLCYKRASSETFNLNFAFYCKLFVSVTNSKNFKMSIV